MVAEPIYLLDFRNLRVTELDPAEEHQGQTQRPAKERDATIKFAALGTPSEAED